MHAQGTAVPAGQGANGHVRGEERAPLVYTVAEVAVLLDKHIQTIYRWVRTGDLPSKKVGGTIFIPRWALARFEAAPDGGETA